MGELLKPRKDIKDEGKSDIQEKFALIFLDDLKALE